MKQTLYILALSLLAAQAWPQGDGPAATVGRVKGLSVAENVTTAAQHGSLFPIEVTAERVDPKNAGWTSDVQLDAYAQQTVSDVFAYLAGADQRNEIALPKGFLTDFWYEIHFTLGGQLVAGDSAGCALATAIYSKLTDTPILDDVSITGAISPDGTVLSVGDIAMKIDGVIGSHTGTMILPAENGLTTREQMAAVVRKAFPDIRIVTVTDMRQVMFYALGPYGPEAQRYREYATDYARAVQLADGGEVQEAFAAFEALSKAYPEDNTPSVWIAQLHETELKEYIRKATRALKLGDRDRAREIVLEAFDKYPDSPEIGELLNEIAGVTTAPRADNNGGPEQPAPTPGEVVAQMAAQLPSSPKDSAWSVCVPGEVSLRAAGASADERRLTARAQALYTGDRFALLLTFEDPSGSAERTSALWRLGPEGFTRAGHDDAIQTVWDRGIRTGRVSVRSADELDRPTEFPEPVDLWAWRAGTTDIVGHADDWVLSADELAGDAGGPLCLSNIDDVGSGPRYVFGGSAGLYRGSALDVDSVVELKGDPLAGRASFETACARCHSAGSPPRQASVVTDITQRPEGAPEALRRQLTETKHADVAQGLSVDDLIAYIQTCAPIPTIICRPPSGSRADVTAESAFAEGWWGVAMQRRLMTGQPDDLPMQPDGEYGFYLIVNDGAADSTWLSDRIVLRFAAR